MTTPVHEHEPRARYCIRTDLPREELRDDLKCPACDELAALMMLDPDVEVLTDQWRTP